MAQFVDSTVKDIDARLRELRDEVKRLEAARSALTGRGPGRPRGTGTATATRRRRPGRPRGRRRGGTRAEQALKLVQSQPGITIPEIAKAINIEPNYLYRVLPKLQDNGQVKKDGNGWVPA
jgi:hypothetical protein